MLHITLELKPRVPARPPRLYAAVHCRTSEPLLPQAHCASSQWSPPVLPAPSCPWTSGEGIIFLGPCTTLPRLCQVLASMSHVPSPSTLSPHPLLDFVSKQICFQIFIICLGFSPQGGGSVVPLLPVHLYSEPSSGAVSPRDALTDGGSWAEPGRPGRGRPVGTRAEGGVLALRTVSMSAAVSPSFWGVRGWI